MIDLKKTIRAVPDFPKKGIIFRDITTLMQDPQAFKKSCDILYERYKDANIDKIAGIDARGFVFGAVLAYKLNKGFIPVRKKGKLPHDIITEKYKLEYGESELEMHRDSVRKGEKIVIIDDLIATGGTVKATANMIEQLGGEVVECAFVVELPELNGRKILDKYKVYSILNFEGH